MTTPPIVALDDYLEALKVACEEHNGHMAALIIRHIQGDYGDRAADTILNHLLAAGMNRLAEQVGGGA